jgi:DNA-binding transcriptional regulator YiaG
MARRKKKRYRRNDEEMIRSLQKRLSELRARVTARKRKQAALAARPKAEPGPRFSPGWLASHREKLELSAADYAELVGVSPLTIYNWEKGKSRPRRAQLKALAEVRGMQKREAWRELGYVD